MRTDLANGGFGYTARFRTCRRYGSFLCSLSPNQGPRHSGVAPPPMSCPVSTPWSGRDRLIVVEECLEAVVGGGVVGGVVLPAAPDDVGPGAGEDADGVGVVAAAGDGLVVEVGGPGAGAAGVCGEVAQGVAELLVGSPAEGDGFGLPGLPGGGGDSGQAGQGVAGGEPAAGVADLGEQAGARGRCRSGAGTGRSPRRGGRPAESRCWRPGPGSGCSGSAGRRPGRR